MKKFKKMIYLVMITVFISGNIQAQEAVNGQKIITITTFKVYENNAQLVIDWSTDGRVETNYWQVQSSTDGQKFSTIALVFGPDPRQKGDNYQYKGKIKDASDGTETYYRVTPVDAKGQEISTEIVQSVK